jgi:hypothetical protein
MKRGMSVLTGETFYIRFSKGASDIDTRSYLVHSWAGNGLRCNRRHHSRTARTFRGWRFLRRAAFIESLEAWRCMYHRLRFILGV